MHRIDGRRLTRFMAGLCGFWLGLAGTGASAAGMTLTPANPTVSTGQTQRFGELSDWTSFAADATTLAVTIPLSHAVYLVALAE